MGLFGTKKLNCPKDTWTTLISSVATGIPVFWTITLTTKDGSAVEGKYIEKRYQWIFPQQSVSGDLKAQMTFHRYWINAIYWVKICPTSDLIAEIK
jgi:hypothetical protein